MLLGPNMLKKCVAGTYCPQGYPNDDITAPIPCPDGSSSPEASGSIRNCSCVQGRYQPIIPYCGDEMDDSTCYVSCPPCPPGQVCLDPNSPTVSPCPLGRVCVGGGTTEPCPVGFYCPENTSIPISCTAGQHCLGNLSQAPPCPSGMFCSDPSTIGIRCPEGTYCPAGSRVPTPCPVNTSCPAGSSSVTAGCFDTCVSCVAGTYCTGGSSVYSCPPGHFCPTNSISPSLCPANTYCNAGFASPCPSGTLFNGTGATSSLNCTACPSSTLCPPHAAMFVSCMPGWYTSSTPPYQCTPCPSPLTSSSLTWMHPGGSCEFKCVDGYEFRADSSGYIPTNFSTLPGTKGYCHACAPSHVQVWDQDVKNFVGCFLWSGSCPSGMLPFSLNGIVRCRMCDAGDFPFLGECQSCGMGFYCPSGTRKGIALPSTVNPDDFLKAGLSDFTCARGYFRHNEYCCSHNSFLNTTDNMCYCTVGYTPEGAGAICLS